VSVKGRKDSRDEWFGTETGEHQSVASAKTAGIIIGILIPVILIVFCIIVCCQRVAKRDADPEVYYTEKSFTTPMKSPSPYQQPKVIELQLVDDPNSNPGQKEDMKMLREPPTTTDNVDQIEKLEGSPRSPRSSTSSGHRNSSNGVTRRTKTVKTTTIVSADDSGQRNSASSSKIMKANYDGVYYTGEPIPGRANIDFSDSDFEHPTSPQRTISSTSQNNSAFVSPKVSV